MANSLCSHLFQQCKKGLIRDASVSGFLECVRLLVAAQGVCIFLAVSVVCDTSPARIFSVVSVVTCETRFQFVPLCIISIFPVVSLLRSVFQAVARLPCSPSGAGKSISGARNPRKRTDLMSV